MPMRWLALTRSALLWGADEPNLALDSRARFGYWLRLGVADVFVIVLERSNTAAAILAGCYATD